jgi:Zinc dependent phospholipase C
VFESDYALYNNNGGTIMPDFWTHHYAALEIKKQLPSRLLWPDHLDALYFLGAQGPDFLFYIGRFNPWYTKVYRKTGNEVHAVEIEQLFQSLFNTCAKLESDAARAYLFGFISHYMLDVYCHPIIDRLGDATDGHKRVEMDYETLMLHTKWQIPAKELPLSSYACSNSLLKEGFTPYWNVLIPELYGTDVNDVPLLMGRREMLRIQSLVSREVIGTTPFYKLLGKALHYDLSLLMFSKVPVDKLSREREFSTFLAHYHQAITVAVTCIDDITSALETKTLPDTLVKKYFDKNFSGEAYAHDSRTVRSK